MKDYEDTGYNYSESTPTYYSENEYQAIEKQLDEFVKTFAVEAAEKERLERAAKDPYFRGYADGLQGRLLTEDNDDYIKGYADGLGEACNNTCNCGESTTIDFCGYDQDVHGESVPCICCSSCRHECVKNI